MRIALWIASPPTCSVLTPPVADRDDRSVARTANAATRLIFRLALHVADARDVLLKASDRVIRMVRCRHSVRLGGDIARYSCKNPAKYPDCYPRLYPSIKGGGMAWHAMGKYVVRHLVGNERLQNSRPRQAVDQ